MKSLDGHKGNMVAKVSRNGDPCLILDLAKVILCLR